MLKAGRGDDEGTTKRAKKVKVRQYCNKILIFGQGNLHSEGTFIQRLVNTKNKFPI